MEFVNIPFPPRLAFGAQADALWSTNIVTTAGGLDSANQNWQDCRHQYDVSFAVRVLSDFTAIRAHFHQVRGRAKCFPFLDFLDHSVAQAEGPLLATAVANVYQMHKRYGAGSEAYDRKITRPTSSTVYRTRAGVTSVITATVDASTGKVTVSGHLSGDTYNWAGEFVVPCRYDTDRLPAVATNRQPGADGELFVQCDAITLLEVKE